MIVIHYSETTHQMKFPIILKVTEFSSQRNKKGEREPKPEIFSKKIILLHIIIQKLALEFNLCLYKPCPNQNIVKTIPENTIVFFPNSIKMFGWETEKKSILPHFLFQDFREKLSKNQS